MRRQQSETAQVHAALGQGGKNPGTRPHRTCDLETLPRRVLGQVQLADAILVHRGVARFSEESAAPNLGDQCDLPRGVRTVLGDALLEFANQRFIRETTNRDALHGALLDGGGWSRADASILRCANSASAAARTSRESAYGRAG